MRVDVAPGGVGSVWDLRVERTRDVEDLPNLVRPNVGSAIKLYVHPDLKLKPHAGQRIEAHVFFQGDERGGGFFLKGDEVKVLR